MTGLAGGQQAFRDGLVRGSWRKKVPGACPGTSVEGAMSVGSGLRIVRDAVRAPALEATLTGRGSVGSETVVRPASC